LSDDFRIYDLPIEHFPYKTPNNLTKLGLFYYPKGTEGANKKEKGGPTQLGRPFSDYLGSMAARAEPAARPPEAWEDQVSS
jgi:hypothetical protein